MTRASGPDEPANALAHDDAKVRAAEAVSHLRRVFGHTIRLLRELHGIPLPDLAASLSLSEAHLQAIEAGETFVTPPVRAKLELIFGETL